MSRKSKKEEATSSSADLIYDHGINLETLELQVSGPVDDAMLKRVYTGLAYLNQHNTGKAGATITLLLSTPGGYVSTALAIFDIIKSSELPVNVRAMGQVASAGTLILQAGVERQSYANTQFMVHHGATYIESGAERKFEAKMHERWVELMAERAKVSYQKVADWHESDTWFTASDALKVGLIDKIVGQS